MSIMILSQTGSLRVNQYRNVAMTFTSYLDALIEDKAEKLSEGWYLSQWDLTRTEAEHLKALQPDGLLENLINDRCDELYQNWRDSRGFDE